MPALSGHTASRIPNSLAESRIEATCGRLMSDLRGLAHEGTPAYLASPGRQHREAVRPRWRARGDRGESPAQAATDRPAPCSPAGAEPGAERPADLRIGVALPRSRTNPQGRHRRTPLDAPGVSEPTRPTVRAILSQRRAAHLRR